MRSPTPTAHPPGAPRRAAAPCLPPAAPLSLPHPASVNLCVRVPTGRQGGVTSAPPSSAGVEREEGGGRASWRAGFFRVYFAQPKTLNKAVPALARARAASVAPVASLCGEGLEVRGSDSGKPAVGCLHQPAFGCGASLVDLAHVSASLAAAAAAAPAAASTAAPPAPTQNGVRGTAGRARRWGATAAAAAGGGGGGGAAPAHVGVGVGSPSAAWADQ